MNAVAPSDPGSHSASPSLLHTRPPNSCTRKRPTRVPESTVVRMNSASNMMAKWYQYAIGPRGHVFADSRLQGREIDRRDVQVRKDRHRRVDREVITRIERGRRDERHH